MEYYSNIENIKVLTDNGYQDFSGIAYMGEKEIYKLHLEDNLFLECTYDHKVCNQNLDKIEVCKLTINDQILTEYGLKNFVRLEKTNRVEPVYDLIEVNGGHRYYTNNILSSNCEFISAGGTLISGLALKNLEYRDEEFKIDEIRWFSEPIANHIFIVSFDPCSGVGGDYAAIQVFDVTIMEQVAEWRSETIDPRGQVQTLLTVLHYLYDSLAYEEEQTDEPDIYWSLEVNGIGQAHLQIIMDTGVENFPGVFMNSKIDRKGFITTNPNKINSCMKFKSLIESKRMVVHSAPLITEIKNFEKSGNTFKGKPGTHDDLVMAVILMLGIFEKVSQWEPELGEAFSEAIDLDDINIDPMPFIV